MRGVRSKVQKKESDKSSVTLYLQAPDLDAVAERAAAAGGALERGPEDEPGIGTAVS